MKLFNYDCSSAEVIRFAAVAVVASVVVAACAPPGDSSSKADEDTIVVGVLSITEGPNASSGDDTMRGIKMALKEHGDKVAGKKIKIVVEGTDQTGPTATEKVRKLVEQRGAQIVVGPQSGDEGLAVSSYAPKKPDVTFVNGIAAAQKLTTGHPNVFRFAYGDGAQWVAGLGDYAAKDLGIEKVAVVSENYSFAWAQVAGFTVDFCQAGGSVTDRIFTPLGTTNYGSIINKIPSDVDALYLVFNGADSLNFLKAYYQSGGDAKIIASSITVDQTVLSAKGDVQEKLVGVVSASPVAGDIPRDEWKTFVKDYKEAYPDGYSTPSVYGAGAYVNMLATLKGLDAVDGDLSDGSKKFQAALADVELDAPSGHVALDNDRNGLFPVYISKVAKNSDGDLINSVVKTVPPVSAAKYLKEGAASPDTPKCSR